jgi:UDP-glucose 4-epimerase
MIYLITGGAGFIGSHVVRNLLDRGEKVRILDNFATGKREHLVPLEGRVEVIEGDIRYLNNVQEAVAGADYVIHLAALPSVARSVRTPIESNDTNVHGTLNVLIAARDAKVKRVVYAASSSAYGNSATLPKVETMPSDPLSPYAVNKLAGELYCRVFTRVYGLETVSLRYFNVFGPRQDPQSEYAAVIPKFITAALAGRAPRIFGDGTQSRDFCHIDNVIEANFRAAAADARAVSGGVFNIACGQATTLNQVVALIGESLGRKLEAVHEAERAGDIKHSHADIAEARARLGYQAAVSFAEGLRRTIDWYKQQQ